MEQDVKEGSDRGKGSLESDEGVLRYRDEQRERAIAGRRNGG